MRQGTHNRTSPRGFETNSIPLTFIASLRRRKIALPSPHVLIDTRIGDEEMCSVSRVAEEKGVIKEGIE